MPARADSGYQAAPCEASQAVTPVNKQFLYLKKILDPDYVLDRQRDEDITDQETAVAYRHVAHIANSSPTMFATILPPELPGHLISRSAKF